MEIIYGYILTYGYLISILIGVEFLQRKCKIRREFTRKIVHILVGFSWIIMVKFFNYSYHLIIPPLTFVIINYISHKKNLISSIERDENSFGTVYYALSFSILSIITVFYHDFLPYYGIGVLSMCLGDGFAYVLGQKFNKFKIGHFNKTYVGSLTVVLMGIVSSFIIGHYFQIDFKIIDYLIIGLVASVLELFGGKYDNLTLPIGVAIIAYFL